MGRNVFVSYKYGDNNVRQFRHSNHKTSSRDYVNVIQQILEETECFYFNGEYDGNDLSQYSDEFIQSTLYNKIFHTSITIVLITANMRRRDWYEADQWVPREISYSLRNKTREYGNSNMNAVLCIVVPDRNGNYGHAVWEGDDDELIVNDGNLFNIINENLFNNMYVDHYETDRGYPIYRDGDGYFVLTTWDEFENDPEYYLHSAVENRGHWQDYQVRKNINPEW